MSTPQVGTALNSFEGRTAIVTGAASGIGLSLSKSARVGALLNRIFASLISRLSRSALRAELATRHPD